MLVTDRQRFGAAAGNERTSLDRVVASAVRAARAGVDLIQIRERGLEDRDLLELVERTLRETSPTGARTLVNDRVDVAIAAGAHGVHLPGRAMSAPAARSIAPDRFLIGRSVHSEAEAAAVEEKGGCDYLIFGSVFESASKSPGHPVAGLDALTRVCAAVALPVIAIGGITRSRITEVAAAGAAGVAAIGLFAEIEAAALNDLVREIRF